MKTSFLTDKRLKGIEVGKPEWFSAQKAMINSKPLIKKCYDLWYKNFLSDIESVPDTQSRVLELGSGSSYLKDMLPNVITSDVIEGVADQIIDARQLPFEDNSLRAIVLSHVFHHIPDVQLFLSEAQRVLVPGGIIAMVEVTHTPFGKFFFSTFHPEPYDDETKDWTFPQADSMLDSNQALAWIVFNRDYEKFKNLFPSLLLEEQKFLPWFSYLLSGGVNLRSFVPKALCPMVSKMDNFLKPLDGVFAIHKYLRIRKAV